MLTRFVLLLALALSPTVGKDKAPVRIDEQIVKSPKRFQPTAASFLSTGEELLKALDQCESVVCRTSVDQTSATLNLRTPAPIKELKSVVAVSRVIRHDQLESLDKALIVGIRLELTMPNRAMRYAVILPTDSATIFAKLVKSTFDVSEEH